MNIKIKTMTLLPPAPGKCVVCAVAHSPEEPHNRQSLYYQLRFFQEHGRIPTWDDAMSHCAPAILAAWHDELRKHDVEVAP